MNRSLAVRRELQFATWLEDEWYNLTKVSIMVFVWSFITKELLN